MDQDFVIEETNPFKVGFFILLILGGIGFGIYKYVQYVKNDKVKLKTVTIELGEMVPTDISTYIESHNLNSFTLDTSNIKVDEDGKTLATGEYSYKVTRGAEIKKGKVKVVDSIKPIVVVQDLTVGVKENFDPGEFIKSCEDLSLPCSARFKNKKDIDLVEEAGKYVVDIIISDAAGNEVNKTINLTVSEDDSLEEQKTKDLEVSYTTLEDDSIWDKTFTEKFDKALDDDSIEYVTRVSILSGREYDFSKKIKSKEIVVLYNKYDYAVGFSLMVTFEDDSVIFVTKDNSKEIFKENVEE